MNVEVFKEDITLIGHTSYNYNGRTAIICTTGTNHLEFLLLRSILKCFGEEYRVTETFERFEDPDDLRTVMDRVYITNLPWDIYIATPIPSPYGPVE